MAEYEKIIDEDGDTVVVPILLKGFHCVDGARRYGHESLRCSGNVAMAMEYPRPLLMR